jgi:hypothetical protein
VTTKFGFKLRPDEAPGWVGLDSRPEHIKEAAEGSLKRLKVPPYTPQPNMRYELLRGTAAGGQALQHPDDRDLARCGRDRPSQQHYGFRLGGEGPQAYEIAIPAESFADMAVFAMSQPEDVDVNEILFRPTRQEY